MKWMVVSDTHRRTHELHAAALLVQNDVDLIIHAGDEVADAAWLSRQIDLPVVGVAGNWDRPTTEFPIERTCDGEVRALVVHGHRHGVKVDLHILADEARSQHAPLAIFGHTHVPLACQVGQTILMNPGSLAEPRDGSPATFALVRLRTEANGQAIHITHLNTTGETVFDVTFPVILP